MGAVISHPSAGGAPATSSPGPIEPSASSGSSGLSSKESWWRKVQLDSANAQGDWNGAGNGDDGHMKRSHDHVVENCGHDVRVSFDWNTFDMNHWIEFQKKQQRPDDVIAGFCTYSQIYELGSACASDSPLKSYQRDAIKQIKTVTCHYKPCNQLPDMPGSAPGRQEVASIAQYALGNGGTNLDVTFCESEANASASVNAWMRAM